MNEYMIPITFPATLQRFFRYFRQLFGKILDPGIYLKRVANVK